MLIININLVTKIAQHDQAYELECTTHQDGFSRVYIEVKSLQVLRIIVFNF